MSGNEKSGDPQDSTQLLATILRKSLEKSPELLAKQERLLSILRSQSSQNAATETDDDNRSMGH
jgi:hypothetical protein